MVFKREQFTGVGGWGVSSLLILFTALSPLAANPVTAPLESKTAPNKAAERSVQLDEINQAWLAEMQGKASPKTPAAPSDSAAGTTSSEDASNLAEGRIILNNPGSDVKAKSESGAKLDSDVKSAPSNANDTAVDISDLKPKSSIFDEPVEDISFVSVAMRFVLMLALMLAIFYFLLRVLRRRQGAFNSGGELITVIASQPILPGKFIQIVDLAGKLMVLGVSDSGVNILSVVEDARTADRIRLWHSEQSANASLNPAGFLEWLSGFIKGADYRFWNQSVEREGGKNLSSGELFSEVLARHGVKFSAAQGGEVSDDELYRNQAEMTPASRDDSDDDSQQELARLLKLQRRKLASLKKES